MIKRRRRGLRFRALTFPFVTSGAGKCCVHCSHALARGAKAREPEAQKQQREREGKKPSPNSPSIIGLSPTPGLTLNGQCLMSAWIVASLNLRPISLLASNTVLIGFIATCDLAASPIRRSVSVNATYDGVVRFPWREERER